MEKRLNNLKIFQPKGTGQEDGNFDWLRFKMLNIQQE